MFTDIRKGVGGSINAQKGNSLATLHYAAGGGLDSQGNFTPAQAGFNLADVSSVDELNQLPNGVQGLVWLDQYSGVTQSFIDQVTVPSGMRLEFGVAQSPVT